MRSLLSEEYMERTDEQTVVHKGMNSTEKTPTTIMIAKLNEHYQRRSLPPPGLRKKVLVADTTDIAEQLTAEVPSLPHH